MFDANFTLLDVSYSRISKKWPKYCPFLAKIWSSHCPSNWFFLNLNQFAQECSMLNFTLLGLSCCPFFLETAKICPFYGKTWSSHGPSNWLFLNPNWCDQGCSMQISHCWVYPVANFPINGQKMALLWPKHGTHMALQIGSSWILINVPRDAPCQISDSWLQYWQIFSTFWLRKKEWGKVS